MTTPKREYRPGVPVLVTFRWHLRMRLFDVDPLCQLFLKLIARWSVDADVDILALSIRPNHAHLILVQHVEDCPATKGIAAFMRNVSSPVAKLANRLLGSKGHALESTYHAYKLPKVIDLVRELSYVHYQDQHHHGPGHLDSRPVYYAQQIDGIVTHLPLLPTLDRTLSPEGRQAVLLRLMNRLGDDAIRREGLAAQQADPNQPDLTERQFIQSLYPWASAREHLHGQVTDVDLDAPTETLDLICLRDDPRFAEAVRPWLDWRPPHLAVEPLPLPPLRVGQRVEIHFRFPQRQPASPTTDTGPD